MDEETFSKLLYTNCKAGEPDTHDETSKKHNLEKDTEYLHYDLSMCSTKSENSQQLQSEKGVSEVKHNNLQTSNPETLKTGTVVFATLKPKIIKNKTSTLIYYAGIIVDGEDCHFQKPKANYLWVYWFITRNLSMVPMENIIDFASNLKCVVEVIEKKVNPKCQQKHFRSIREAISVFEERWSRVYSQTDFNTACVEFLEDYKIDEGQIPENIARRLKEIKNTQQRPKKSSEEVVGTNTSYYNREGYLVERQIAKNISKKPKEIKGTEQSAKGHSRKHLDSSHAYHNHGDEKLTSTSGFYRKSCVKRTIPELTEKGVKKVKIAQQTVQKQSGKHGNSSESYHNHEDHQGWLDVCDDLVKQLSLLKKESVVNKKKHLYKNGSSQPDTEIKHSPFLRVENINDTNSVPVEEEEKQLLVLKAKESFDNKP